LLYLGRARDLRYRSPQTEFHAAAAAARFFLLKHSGDAKIMVRNHPGLMNLQFFKSPFSQLNGYFPG
jgi:hypothetical protein